MSRNHLRNMSNCCTRIENAQVKKQVSSIISPVPDPSNPVYWTRGHQHLTVQFKRPNQGNVITLVLFFRSRITCSLCNALSANLSRSCSVSSSAGLDPTCADANVAWAVAVAPELVLVGGGVQLVGGSAWGAWCWRHAGKFNHDVGRPPLSLPCKERRPWVCA